MILGLFVVLAATMASKIVLHFDVNETIILEDIAGGDTREMCLNKIIAKSAAVLPAAGGSWTWLDGTPLNDQTPQPVSSLSTTFELPPSAVPYYRVKSLKPNALNFTTHEHGSRFRGIYDDLVAKMTHGSLPEALSKDGNTHFVLPSFFRTVAELHKSKRSFNIVIRTFGYDLPEIAKSITAFAQGLHPDFPDFVAPEFEVTDEKIFEGRYISTDAGANVEWRLSNPETKSNLSEAEALELMESSRITLVQDDYDHWKASGYNPQCGKPCWVTKGGGSTKHIFFDDNIWPDPKDSIVAVRQRESEGGDYVPMSGEEIMAEESKSIVKVFGIEACLDDNYFLNKINLCCTANPLRALDREVIEVFKVAYAMSVEKKAGRVSMDRFIAALPQHVKAPMAKLTEAAQYDCELVVPNVLPEVPENWAELVCFSSCVENTLKRCVAPTDLVTFLRLLCGTAASLSGSIEAQDVDVERFLAQIARGDGPPCN
ncbi:hypothetical protein TrST_g9759 [Triparma strigata]|uniref:Uncharacterized protein n=1 Tax=Triparma strigata TaxID=1606541 RepID=A0A9W6ZS79_9STRA|nr:hypothetical protein TrST_g9759 [Triparma strigata]